SKKYLKSHIDDLCSVCKNRLEYNALRVLDCKNKECHLVIEQVPLIESYLCGDCQTHFQQVKVGLKDIGIRFNLNPRLVRGLDYYTRTVFEFVVPSLGAQGTICGGGRYDNLIEELGGPSTPAAGFSIGIERLLIALNKNRAEIPSVTTPFVYIVTLGETNQAKAYQIAALFRSQGIRTWLNLLDKSLSSQLKTADKKEIRWVMIVGEREVTENKFVLRDMQTGHQEKIDWADLKQFIKRFKSTVCSI
nr:histidine--tRNA ligase [Clostridia bacterium]